MEFAGFVCFIEVPLEHKLFFVKEDSRAYEGLRTRYSPWYVLRVTLLLADVADLSTKLTSHISLKLLPARPFMVIALT